MHLRWQTPILLQSIAAALFTCILSADPGLAQAPQPRVRPAAPAPVLRTPLRDETKRRGSENFVTIMGSGRQTSYTQFSEDIANVLEILPGNDLRIIPMLGMGAGQNVLDMLQLKGVDMAFADKDVLEYVRRKNPSLYGDIDKRINYIAKIFNLEFLIYGKKDIKSLEDLAGKKVSCLKEGSTVGVLCENLFRMLKIDGQVVWNSGEVAYQKVLSGEIAAAVDGAPAFGKMRAQDGIHFIPVSEDSLPSSDFDLVRATYVPALLSHKDFPNLIPEGEEVPTIAQSSMLMVYAWPPGTQRYQMLEKFTRMFFDNIDSFRKPPRHPKWVDINLATEVPGWTRFPPARQWLDAKRQAVAQREATDQDPRLRVAFRKFLEDYARKTGTQVETVQSDALLAQFIEWWKAREPQRR